MIVRKANPNNLPDILTETELKIEGRRVEKPSALDSLEDSADGPSDSKVRSRSRMAK